MNPMETIPTDQPVLVYAEGWKWEGEDRLYEPGWRVCECFEYGNGVRELITITANPYTDSPVNPLGWVELPPAPERNENETATLDSDP